MNTPRPKGARLLTAFSPKLGRTVRAFDHAGFEQWIRLEADPAVIAFCEHPRHVNTSEDGRLIDFWVARRDQEEVLVIERGQGAPQLPQFVESMALRLVPAVELAAAATWISNWLRMIPVINATRGLTPKTLVRSALNLVRKPLALSYIERELSGGDPTVVRGAVFELLRTGQLMAPLLHTQALSLHTTVEPVT